MRFTANLISYAKNYPQTYDDSIFATRESALCGVLCYTTVRAIIWIGLHSENIISSVDWKGLQQQLQLSLSLSLYQPSEADHVRDTGRRARL